MKKNTSAKMIKKAIDSYPGELTLIPAASVFLHWTGGLFSQMKR